MDTTEHSEFFSGKEAVSKLNSEVLEAFAYDSEMEYVNSENELPAAMAAWHSRIQNVINTQQVVIDTVGENNNVVSLGGFEQIGWTKDGRPVIETGRSITLQTHRGQGHYGRVTRKVMEEVEKKYPNAVIVRCTQKTKNDDDGERKKREAIVCASCEKMGFSPLDAKTYLQFIKGFATEINDENIRATDEYHIYMLDLSRQ